MAETRAQSNRRVRQEALRDQLEAKGLCQKVLETCEILVELSQPLESVEVQRLKAANDARLALIKKYLPDIKTLEVTGEDGQAIKINASVIAAEMTQEQATRIYQELIKS